MKIFSTTSPISWVGAVAALVVASTLSTRGAGIQSGLNGSPAGCSEQLPSCQVCHSNSAPFTGRSGPPIATMSVGTRALNFGQVISVTTAVSGGVGGSNGGFVTEATSGTFTAGGNSHTLTSNSSITHVNKNSRSWTFSYTAPNAAGPVSLTSCNMTSNGSGTSNDEFSFVGFDPNATVATPVRLYVLPQGVTNMGTACADGFGNLSVLGANSSPTVGNAGFAVELIGTTPSTVAILFAGFNPAGFQSVPLGLLLGLTGCDGHLANIANSFSTFTTGGSAERAEGTASFPIPIPNMPSLVGASFDLQGAYVDGSVAALRNLPLSLSNGVNVTVQ